MYSSQEKNMHTYHNNRKHLILYARPYILKAHSDTIQLVSQYHYELQLQHQYN